MPDFGSSDLDAFRAKARAWLEENFPASLRGDPGAAMEGAEAASGDRDLWRRLASQGARVEFRSHEIAIVRRSGGIAAWGWGQWFCCQQLRMVIRRGLALRAFDLGALGGVVVKMFL